MMAATGAFQPHHQPPPSVQRDPRLAAGAGYQDHGGMPQHHHLQQQQPLQHQHPFQPQQQQQQQTQQQLPPPAQQQQQSGPPLNLRLIVNRDEVSYLFGFDGVLLGQLRQQTGAAIALTDSPSYEQVLTITGSLEVIFKAFSLVCRKLWDFITSLAQQQGSQQQTQRPLVLRLAVPASQCGSIIGKHGAKVKEIRDLTGANIQVSQDSLPDSTERSVEISGTGEACLQCTYHICTVMQEAPLRGEVVPYVPGGGGARPRTGMMHGGGGESGPADNWKPVFLCGDKAYVIDGGIAAPAPPELLRRELAKTPLGDMAESLASLSVNNFGGHQQHQQQAFQQQQPAAPFQQQQPPMVPDHMNPLALMQAISSAQRNNVAGGPAPPQTSREMTVSADLLSAVAGKNGSKVAEIRRISGAQLHVPREDELTPEQRARPDRTVTISGTQESILLAQFLVQSNVDMANKDRQEQQQQHQQDRNGGGGGASREQRRFHNDPRRRDSSGGGGGGGFRGGRR